MIRKGTATSRDGSLIGVAQRR